jgi:hypothetical protein
LSVPAKRLWSEITSDRPADFFRPGSFELLELYCELTIRLRGAVKELKAVSAEDCPVKLRAVKDLSTVLVVLATKLRLTIQADVDRRARGKLSERGDSPLDAPIDPLIGGRAVWGERPQ